MNSGNTLKLNTGFNPFIFPILFGQGYSTIDGRPAGFWTLACNVTFIAFLLTCYVVNVYTLENKFGDEGYSFISNINFCIQIYAMPINACLTAIIISLNRKSIYNCITTLTDIITELDKVDIPTERRFLKIVILLFSAFVIILAQLIADITVNGRNFSLFFWICAYLPGTAVTVNNIHSIAFFESCNNRFLAINSFLEKSVNSNVSSFKRVSLANRNAIPHKLMKKLPHTSITVFDKVFEQHSRTCTITDLCNEVIGIPLLIFMALLTGSSLSFVYNCIMDCTLLTQQRRTKKRTVYVCDFWAVMYIIETILYLKTFVTLTKNGNYTKIILHKLLNIYPDLEAMGSIYSLQLIHQRIKLTAAGYFTLDATIILKISVAVIQYLLILIQLKADA